MNSIPATLSTSQIIFATAIGAAIPAVAFGRSVFAVFLGVAFVSMMVCRDWREVAAELRRHALSAVGLLVLLTFLCWLPNALYSNFPVRSLEAVTRTLLFVGIAVAFCTTLGRDERLFNLAIRSFVIMSAVTVVFALLSMTVLPEIFWFLRLKGWQDRLVESGLKTFTGLSVVILPLLAIAFSRLEGKWRWMIVAIVPATLLAAWLSYNRSAIAGWLAIAVAVTFALFIRRGAAKYILLQIGATVSLFVVMLGWLRISRESFLRSAPKDELIFPVWLIDFERQAIWKKTWEFAFASPWFGVGANAVNFVPGSDATIEGPAHLNVIPAHPHNWVLEIFAETGFFGLSALLVLICVVTYRMLAAFRRTGNLGMIVACAIMAGYWASGLFNFSYWSAWWQLSFLIGLVLAFGYPPRADRLAPK